MPSPTIIPGCEQHAKLLRCFRSRGAISAPIEQPTGNGSDHDHQSALRRQINSETDCQRWNAHVLCRAREDFVQQDDTNADQSADPDQTPVDIPSNDSLRERRYQSCLRRGQRVRTRFSARRSDETVSMIHEVEHRRNDERSRDDANNQRDLLLPRRRINQLSGLEILKLLLAIAATLKITAVVKSANAISALPASGDTYGLTPITSSNAAPITTKIPMPDNGLFDEPISPAM